jgi:hypothetical protein
MAGPWTNFSQQDKTWAKFSTLEVAICMRPHFSVLSVKLPNLQLKTRPKQLLGSLPLVIALPGKACLLYVCTVISMVQCSKYS